MATRILMANNAAALEAALDEFTSTVTVEAEYGESVVEGSILTLAHHGPRAGNPAPCLANNGVAGEVEVEVIGLSHLDLDALGGVMAVLGRKPEADSFWALAAHVDIHGPHKIQEAEASDQNVTRLYAFWAWSQQHRLLSPKDGSVADVTSEVAEAMKIVGRILADDEELLAAGEQFRLTEESLNKRSFIQTEAGVTVRVADAFVNHLYSVPTSEVTKAVVAFNTITGGITISLADPIPGVSARKIVQDLWGPDAGGHDGIAGSPRGQRMTLADIAKAFEATGNAVASPEVLLPEGFRMLRITSEYNGSHPECGCDDQEFIIGLQIESELEVGDFKLSHLTSSPSWEDLKKVPSGSLLWDESSRSWETFPENTEDLY